MTVTARTSTSYERYPAPFPTDLPTIDLQTISIDDLCASNNADISKKLFSILTTEGFFYLDLTTGERGTALGQVADELHDAAQHVFDEGKVTVQEKEEYLGLSLIHI